MTEHLDFILSTDFFDNNKDIGKKWKGKTGVYCLEQPLISKSINKGIYKVGYARNSLYTRMSNYRTAYGPAPFKIYCLMEIPSGVVNNRTAFALLNEQRIHKTLTESGIKSEANEWFYDLDKILSVMNTLKEELNTRISYAHKWQYFIKYKLTRYSKFTLAEEKSIKSKLFDGIEYNDRLRFNRVANFKGTYTE